MVSDKSLLNRSRYQALPAPPTNRKNYVHTKKTRKEVMDWTILYVSVSGVFWLLSFYMYINHSFQVYEGEDYIMIALLGIIWPIAVFLAIFGFVLWVFWNGVTLFARKLHTIKLF